MSRVQKTPLDDDRRENLDNLFDATLLIIDDKPQSIGFLIDYLGEKGFTVLVAQDGESGIQRTQQVQPDLILLDIMMPGIDGFEVCRRLKADDNTKEIPVIFMTALGKTEEKVAGFAAGGVDYVTKPIQQEEVLARVTTHLCLRRSQRQLERSRDELDLRVKERTTELEQVVTALGESEEKYRGLYNSIRDAILVADTNREIIDCNSAFILIANRICEN